MDIVSAQADLRRAYADGGPGVFVSGVVWLVAAIVEARGGIGAGFAALFFGGMLIFPAALLVNRHVLRRAAEAKDNPFGKLVLECTIAMIGGLLAAWLFLPHAPGLVIPLAAIAVGTHYFVFRTAYGDARFWLLGGAIAAVGCAAIFGPLLRAEWVAPLVAAVEIGFGALLSFRALRSR